MADPDAVEFDTDMQTIRDYTSAVVETQTKIAAAYTGALANFETTVRSASATEAKADLVGAVLKSGLKAVEKEAVTAVKEETGADLGPIVDMLHAVSDELDRAAKAAESLAVGDWIKELVRLPGGRQRAGFCFTVTDHAGDDQFGIIECGPERVAQGVP